MKYLPIPHSIFTLTAISCLGLAQFAETAVLDDFSSGTPNTTNTPGFLQSGGNGWSQDWNLSVLRTTDYSVNVSNSNPFPSGNNYLSIHHRRNVASGANAHFILRREFDTAVVNDMQYHNVQFDVRLDSATHWLNTGTGEVLGFYAGATSPASREAYLSPTNTWSLTYDGIEGWRVLYGDGNGGVAYSAPGTKLLSGADGNTTYSVSVHVHSETQQFSVSVSDGSRTETWDDQLFAFINPDSTGSNYLSFYNHVRNGVSISYSLDNITVVPETGTVAAWVGSFLALFLILQRKRLKGRLR